MMDVLKQTIKYLKAKGVDYADLRQMFQLHESLSVKNGLIENISTSSSEGAGIRVLYKGSWGFASTPLINPDALKKASLKAIDLARCSAIIKKEQIKLSPNKAVRASYQSPCEIDPFEVPLEKKVDYLMWANNVLREHQNIRTAKCCLDFYRTDKKFLNTEGSVIEQKMIESGGFIEATAVLGNDAQKRSYPCAHHSQLAQAGYEYAKTLDLVGGAKQARDEAVQLLRAKELPQGVASIILESSQLALQIHESCGHPSELDRALGEELSFAGGSFLTPDKFRKLRYGSKLVNIFADATCEGGVGTCAYDDEGVKAQRVPLIENGLFVGYLSSRETAARLKLKSAGCMRAESWNMIPIVRMTNINLSPGEPSYNELLRDTKKGYLLATNKSWSIDDRRLNFQFSTEIAWEIRNGRLGQVYKNPIYTGITPEFWGGMTAVADKDSWRLWGIPNCAKGEPMQIAHVGHGASPARFEKVQVGRL